MREDDPSGIAGNLVGGTIWLSLKEDAEKLKARLLSPDGMKLHVALLDNVKSVKFSFQDLEAIITAPIISGKRLYVGEARRSNATVSRTATGSSVNTSIPASAATQQRSSLSSNG